MVKPQTSALAWERLRTDDSEASRRLGTSWLLSAEACQLVDSIFAASPFLTDLILRDPDDRRLPACAKVPSAVPTR